MQWVQFGAVWVIWTHCTRFDLCFHLPLSKKYSKFLTKKRIFRLKPQTARKFDVHRDLQTLRNRKPHMKPHSQGTKTATRNTLQPRPVQLGWFLIEARSIEVCIFYSSLHVNSSFHYCTAQLLH